MQVWRYGWTIAPLVGTVALGTVLVVNQHPWIGGLVIAVGVLGLHLVILKEIVERPERAHAFYLVNGPQATYLYSYVEFRRLPEPIRHALLRDREVVEWFKRETQRLGGEMFEAYGTPFGKIRHRLRLGVIAFLT